MVDPEKNFFTTRSMQLIKPEKQKEWVIAKDVKIVPVLTKLGFVPKSVEYTNFHIIHADGKMVATKKYCMFVEFDNFEFNIGLKPDDLNIELPKDTIIRNMQSGIFYKPK